MEVFAMKTMSASDQLGHQPQPQSFNPVAVAFYAFLCLGPVLLGYIVAKENKSDEFTGGVLLLLMCWGAERLLPVYGILLMYVVVWIVTIKSMWNLFKTVKKVHGTPKQQ